MPGCSGGWEGVLSRGPQTDPFSPLLPAGYSTSSFLQMLHPDCRELPEPNLLPGQLSHGAVGVKEGRVQWISMAFESVSSQRPLQAQCLPHGAWPRSEGRLLEVKLLPPGPHGYEC